MDVRCCPYCGGKGTVCKAKWVILGERFDLYGVMCKKCHVETKNCLTKSEAIRDWNDRKIEVVFYF